MKVKDLLVKTGKKARPNYILSTSHAFYKTQVKSGLKKNDIPDQQKT